LQRENDLPVPGGVWPEGKAGKGGPGVDMKPEIMTLPEVAEYLGVSERTVYGWAQKGKIPAAKLGSAWRFKRSEIERWRRDRDAKTHP